MDGGGCPKLCHHRPQSCILIADFRSTVQIIGMTITLRSFVSYRPGLAVILATIVVGCGSTELHLPSCWRASDLKQGLTFRGTVLIFGGDETRPSMFPLTCDGGVVADLPEGITLPASNGPPFIQPLERRFFQADVFGKVVGFAFGRPSVQLKRVEHVRRATPSWLRR